MEVNAEMQGDWMKVRAGPPALSAAWCHEPCDPSKHQQGNNLLSSFTFAGHVYMLPSAQLFSYAKSAAGSCMNCLLCSR